MLRKIYNIEALRKKIGCETYDELKQYGYDVDEYVERKLAEEKKNTDYNEDYVANVFFNQGGYDSTGAYWGT